MFVHYSMKKQVCQEERRNYVSEHGPSPRNVFLKRAPSVQRRHRISVNPRDSLLPVKQHVRSRLSPSDTNRPINKSDNTKINISLLNSSRTSAVLSVDGAQCTQVDFDTVVSIKKAPIDAKFINLTGSTIYKTISKKF